MTDKEYILNLCNDSFNKGSEAFADSIIESFEMLERLGFKELTTAQIIDGIKKALKG